MKRLLDALLVLALLPALLWLWWQWSQYEGWITKCEVRRDGGNERWIDDIESQLAGRGA